MTKRMIKIEKGDFYLGSKIRKGSRPLAQEKGRVVFLDEYEIDETPVTNSEYEEFMNAVNYEKPRFWDNPRFNRPDHPVVGVSWYDAAAYAKWAEKSLPTEAEWEKAAKGRESYIYPWGDEFDPTRANISAQTDGTSPVGSYPEGASPYNCLDMIGNVHEWCLDWYDHDAYSRLDWNDRKAPPQNKNVDGTKVLRGASWRDHVKLFTRSAYRFRKDPDTKEDFIGFRCVKRCEKEEEQEKKPEVNALKTDRNSQLPNDIPSVDNTTSVHVDSHLEALMVIDICGSTKIANKYGNGFYTNIKYILEERTFKIADKYNRKFAQDTGDGYFITFDKAEEAIHSSVELLNSIEDYNSKTIDKAHINLRISINFGEVIILSNDNRIGDRVNMVFRLDSVNEENFIEFPGGILKNELPAKNRNRIFITGYAYDELEKEGVESRFLGYFKGKGIGGAFPFYEVLWKDMD